MVSLSPSERLAHMSEMYDAYGYGLDKDMDNYGYGVMVGGKKSRSKKAGVLLGGKRALTAYNLFVRKMKAKDPSMQFAEIAEHWNAKKKGKSKTSKKVSSKTSKRKDNKWIECEKSLGKRGIPKNMMVDAYHSLNCRVSALEKQYNMKFPLLKKKKSKSKI